MLSFGGELQGFKSTWQTQSCIALSATCLWIRRELWATAPVPCLPACCHAHYLGAPGLTSATVSKHPIKHFLSEVALVMISLHSKRRVIKTVSLPNVATLNKWSSVLHFIVWFFNLVNWGWVARPDLGTDCDPQFNGNIVFPYHGVNFHQRKTPILQTDTNADQ